MEPIVGDDSAAVVESTTHATIAVADADQGSPTGLAAGALFPGSPFPQSYLLGASGMVTPQSALAGRSRSSSAVLEPGVGTAPDDGSNPFEGDVLGPASLAGRKRSQPTGGWGWPDDGAVQDCGSNGPQEGVPRKGADHATATCDTAEIRFATGGEAAGTAGVSGEGGAEGAAGGGGGGARNSSTSNLDRRGGTGGLLGESDKVVDDEDAALDDGGEAEQDKTAAVHDVGVGNPAALSLQAATSLGGADTPTMPYVVAAAAGDGAADGSADVQGAPAAAAPVVDGGEGELELTTSPSSAAAAAAGEPTSSSSCLGDFNFSFEELERMSKRYATVNTLGAETPMPLLDWLTRELGMSHDDMRSLLLRYPRLMAYRVTSHVAPKTKWLRERLGLGQAALRKLVITYPAVLSRSVEKNLEPKFKWLEERLGATQEEVSTLIKRFPLIFGYSTTQNLEPTVAFFTVDLCGEQEEIKSAVMSCPSILSRSLDKRMMPRTQLMRDKEIKPRFGPHKWVVSTYTDAQFTRWLEGRGA